MADKYLRDGFVALPGGMDSGTNPTLLPRTTAAFLINGLVRGGFFETRYGDKNRPFIFANEEQEEWFKDNLFQGVEFFAPTERTPMFIVSIGGRIFKIDVINNYRVSEITPVNGTVVVGTTQVVTWTNVVGATNVGNVLTKTAADGWNNSGGFSNQNIIAGNAYIEFSPAQTNATVMIGLGDSTDSGQDYPEIIYGMFFGNASQIEIYESGVMVQAVGTYATTDVFRIEISNGVVYYKKNGTIVYTSTVVPAYPLHVEGIMFHNGGAVGPIQLHNALIISPPIGSSITIPVADTSLIHIGYPITIGDGRYMVTAKTLTTVTATNVDATAGINISYDTPVYYLSPNPSLLSKTWMLQAEGYFLIQNGSDAAIIYDGATARRAVRNGLKLEVPTGTAMAYWQGRIWVAVNKREIEAGDIFGGPTTIIDFTETTYLAEGGRFRVPSNAGDITALKVLPVLDASLGQGPLQIHTRTSISTLNLPVNRERWKEIDAPVQPLVLLGSGATSDKSTLPINTDMFFRGLDGLRSLRMARQEEATTWSNTPISKEMNRVLINDDQKFLQYSSAVLFDNLFLFTVNPLPFNSGRAAYWQGLGVLDFDPISAMGQKSPPVYAGLHQGVNVMQVVKGTFDSKERAFIFVRNASNENELWEVDPRSRFDNDGARIKSVIETRSLDCGKPFTLHRLLGAELWVDNVEGTVTFTLEYKKDMSNCWHQWGADTICVTMRECSPEACFSFANYQPGYKTRIGFGVPPAACDLMDEKPAAVGYTHDIRLTVEGHARIKALLIKATEEAEPSLAPC